MKFLKGFLLIAMYSLLVLTISAQELPPIETYAPQEYNGENQNWAISQAENKTIYVANNAGLLEFDGEVWRLFSSPNESIMRSVEVVDDFIYSGFYMEFGYWKKNSFGTLDYTSLSQKLDVLLIEDEQFWDIFALDNYILFQSLNRIYIYSLLDESFKIIDSDTRITKMFNVDGNIYFHRINDGIYQIKNGQDVLVSSDSKLKENIVINIFDYEEDLLLETQDDGFYLLNNNNLVPWQTEVNNELKTLSVYNSLELNNGDLAIGTISEGIIIISKEGEIKYRINQTNGLSNNTVLSLFEDQDANIWLGLDNGINCLNMESPFRVFNDEKGELGTVYASAVHNENLYLGTNQGLFYKPINSNTNFSFIDGTQGQVWCLQVIEDTLFCGHNSGTFIVNDNKAQKISNVQGTWDIKQVENDLDYLIQGNYNGLHVLKKINNTWSYSHKIAGLDISSRYFESLNDSEIFVSHEYKGVFKIKLDKNLTKAESIDFEPISKGLKSSLAKYNQEILYVNRDGVYGYDLDKKKFLKDTILTSLYNPDLFVSGKIIADEKANTLWSFSKSGINYVTPGKLSKKPEINSIPLPLTLRNNITGYENILALDEQKYLLGTTSGYIIIDLNAPINNDFEISINQITVNKFQSEKMIQSLNKELKGNFQNKVNNIHFFYSIFEFKKFLKAEYQYQLIGMSDTWSDWSSSSEKQFENLPFGDYTFNVRGRINNNFTSNIATYSFNIARPWFATNLMIVIYFIGLTLFSLFMHNIYRRYYKKQRKKLLEQKNRELELQELTSKQQLMRFKNDNLIQDIENKNRELAISTMSLIKKNEFLSTIKKELSQIENDQNTKPIIKLIDNDLNNTDDWKLFEEAFNNADKDFLKKIKSKHDSLTPNDLRLCAYLRLNLSSKEIAPLLNISPRSVEVKRYRLRKKMNLAPKDSLTNYILEL